MNDSERVLPWYRRWTWRKLITRGLLGTVAVILVTAGLVHWHLRSSLPMLNGNLQVAGLSGEVKIERDVAGVPTITSSDRSDTAFALGFLHAQERFFQMDFLRRISSGRLSELLGAALVNTDQSFRKHRFQEAASMIVAKMPENHRAMIRAYCDGVNRGLAELDATPFEYSLLRAKPAEWTENDCIHVIQTMLTDLQNMDGTFELGIGLLHEKIPEEVFQFLVRKGTSWDAALDGTTIEAPNVPSEEVWSVRDSELVANNQGEPGSDVGLEETSPTKNELTKNEPEAIASNNGSMVDSPILKSLFGARDPDLRPGSNNWAVSSSLGKDGRAILASDMHLGLRVPAIWYRAVMKTPCLDGKDRRLVGVTLPGLPALVEGSNGSVAWGMTNSYGDFGDIVELVNVESKDGESEDDSGAYMTPDGPQQIELCVEEVNVGGKTESIEYERTIWGPVVAKKGDRRFVHHWIGDDPDAFDSLVFDLETAESTEEVMELSNLAGILQLNIVAADREGDVGWTLCGRLARRKGNPSRTIQDWSQGGEWRGYLSPEEYPRVVKPESGRVWTANNRVVGGAMMNLIGDSGTSQGGRAHQIRKRLFEQESFNEQDMLAIQLDDEALFLGPWRELLLDTLRQNPESVSDDFLRAVENWEQRASPDSVGYRIVRSFRDNTGEIFLGVDVARSADVKPRKGAVAQKAGLERILPLSYEAMVWDLLTQQPMHWLPAEFDTWDQLLVEAAQTTEKMLTRDGPLEEATWGKANSSNVRHPLSGAIPLISGWLDMPSKPLPGDRHMPRVQSRSFGASQRMVVSPGFEEEGIYHQPGGQSGHPYSPYYRAGYEDWCEGKASPLLPGPTEYTLTLTPK